MWNSSVVMSVAVALAQLPLLEGNAPGRCGVALLRGLHANGLDVRAVAPVRRFAGVEVSDELPPEDLPVELIRLEHSAETHRVMRLRGLASRVHRPRGELADPRYLRALGVAASGADVLHLEETETGWAGRGAAVPQILHVHYLTRLDRDAGPLGRRAWREVTEFAAAERRLSRRAAHLLASSPVVAAELRRLAPRATVHEFAMPLDVRTYGAPATARAPVAGLIGTATWGPTRSAMTELVNRIWPQVAGSVPDAGLLVAGRGSETLGLDGTGRVRICGQVPSARDFFAQIALLLFPLSRGSGVKVKVLEAMASGVPVLTTPAGADGAPRSDGLLVAPDMTSLRDRAIDLLRRPHELWARGQAARADVLCRHEPAVATAPLLDIYSSLG